MPTIGTVLTPILLIVSVIRLVPTYQQVWAVKSRLSTGLLSFVVIEGLFNLAFIALWIFAAVLLFKKSARFPNIYIIAMLGMVVFFFTDAAVTSAFFGQSQNGEGFVQALRIAIAAVVWCPYMARSKRAKNTFVETN